MIVVGLLLMLRGLCGVFVGFPRTNDVMIDLLSFRVGMVWLTIAGVAASWLLAIALGVGLQELRESSSSCTTIRRRQREQASAASARPL